MKLIYTEIENQELWLNLVEIFELHYFELMNTFYTIHLENDQIFFSFFLLFLF